MSPEQYRRLFEAVQANITQNLEAVVASTIDDHAEYTQQTIRRYLIQKGYEDNNELTALAKRLYEDVAGVGFLYRYIYRSDFEELNINDKHTAFVTLTDRKFQVPKDETFLSPQHAIDVVRRIFSRSPSGKTIDEATPSDRAEIEDGIRITASLPPIIAPEDGVSASIRRVDRKSVKGDIVASGMASQAEMDFLLFCLRYRTSIVLSGETDAGKTFTANALLNGLPTDRRIITLEEDFREFYLPNHHNKVSKLTRHSKDPAQNFDLATLIRIAMTENPDYVGVGEFTNYEAFPGLRAARVKPILATTHSTSGYGTYNNLLGLCQLYPDLNIGERTLLEMLIDAFPLVVYLQKGDDGKRRLVEIRETYYADTGIQSQCIFRFVTTRSYRKDGRDVVEGQHKRVHAISPYLQDRLRAKNAPDELIYKYAKKGAEDE